MSGFLPGALCAGLLLFSALHGVPAATAAARAAAQTNATVGDSVRPAQAQAGAQAQAEGGQTSATKAQTASDPFSQPAQAPLPPIPAAVPAAVEDAPVVIPELPALAVRPRARVVLVPDGDTLRLADRRSVRLACVDAPDLAVSAPTVFRHQELRGSNFRLDGEEASDNRREKATNGRRVRHGAEQFGAKEARQALRGLVLGHEATLRAVTNKKDPQGRLVADVILDDGTCLSAWLVENGLAYVVADADFPEAYTDALFALQARALRDRRGFWDVVLSHEAARRPWTGNMETRLFYAASDERAQRIKPRLRRYFGTLQDAFLQGFAPADSRGFWPDAAGVGDDGDDDKAANGRNGRAE